MEWLVTNALSRDVERYQLNSILKDIKASIVDVNNTVSSNASGDVRDVVGKVATSGLQSGLSVTYSTAKKSLDFAITEFVIKLTGDMSGEGTYTGGGNVTITATIDPAKLGIPEAPKDNRYYSRWNGQWHVDMQSSGEVRRRVSMGW